MSKFTPYNTPFPVGVKLPEIKIEKKYYDEVSCSDLEDNYQFLRKLCFKKLKEKKFVEEGFLQPPKGESNENWKKIKKSQTTYKSTI